MRAYHKERTTRGTGEPMHVMLFLDDNSMVIYRNGFKFGLHAREATGHETIKRLAETGDTTGTGYRELDVNDKLANETIALGRKYRQELDRAGILPINAELLSSEKKELLLNNPINISQDFQDKARELYESAGICV